MILGLQIVAIVFSFLMIYLALLNYKRGELNGLEIVSWVLIWAVVVFITVFPELIRTFARTFAVSRLFDMMVVGGFLLVISMVSAAYVRTKRMEKKLEEIVRKDALRPVEEEKKKTPKKKK